MFFDTLYFEVMTYLSKSQCETCIIHYIDPGNQLTQSQMERIEDYVSRKGLERIKERNGER